MTTAKKLQTIAENEPKIYQAGVEQGLADVAHLNDELEQILYGTDTGGKSFYDEFWDSYQLNGERYNYTYGFAHSWDNTIFKPKYDIRPTGDYGDNSMFQFSRPSPPLDLSAGLAYNGVVLDMSQATRFISTFDRCEVVNIPPLDAQNCKLMSLTFQALNDHANIDYSLTINNIREDCVFQIAFRYCDNLVNLTLTGTIGQNGLDLSSSIKLSKASILSVLNALSPTTSGLTVTFSLDAVNKAFETSPGANDGSDSQEFRVWTEEGPEDGHRDNWTIALA